MSVATEEASDVSVVIPLLIKRRVCFGAMPVASFKLRPGTSRVSNRPATFFISRVEIGDCVGVAVGSAVGMVVGAGVGVGVGVGGGVGTGGIVGPIVGPMAKLVGAKSLFVLRFISFPFSSDFSFGVCQRNFCTRGRFFRKTPVQSVI